MSTFTFHNPSGSAYFVLEAIPRKTDGFYPTSSNQIYYISGSSFTGITSSITNPFVINDFKWGAVIPSGTSSFVWGPSGSVEIPASQSRIIGTGMYNMTIGDDAFTYKELYNWNYGVPKITPGPSGGGGGSLATISNAFSMFFDVSSNDQFVVSPTQEFEIDTKDFSYSFWFKFESNGGIYNERPLLTLYFTPVDGFINTNYRWAGGAVARNQGGSGLQFRWYGYEADTGGTVVQSLLSPPDTTYFTPGTWYHYTVNFFGKTKNSTNRTKIDGYINGQLVKTMYTNSTLAKFSGVNKTVGSLSSDWTGDEIAFFTSSLDASTIESIYSASLPLGSNTTADLSTLSTPPVAWYRMGD